MPSHASETALIVARSLSAGGHELRHADDLTDDEHAAVTAAIEDSATAILVRQVLGAVAEFEKRSLVAKLAAASTAIAVAQAQKARGFELRAALSFAELYQSTGRPVDAHVVLAPALEGFSPTPEMPEVAEAQALLGELSNRAG
jgi:hypothetical protein